MNLKEYLVKNDLTYASFAQKLGMKSTSAAMNIFRYCSGDRNPPPATAKKIFSVTEGQVTFDDLYQLNIQRGRRRNGVQSK